MCVFFIPSTPSNRIDISTFQKYYIFVWANIV